MVMAYSRQATCTRLIFESRHVFLQPAAAAAAAHLDTPRKPAEGEMKPTAPFSREEQAPRARMAPLAEGIVDWAHNQQSFDGEKYS